MKSEFSIELLATLTHSLTNFHKIDNRNKNKDGRQEEEQSNDEKRKLKHIKRLT